MSCEFFLKNVKKEKTKEFMILKRSAGCKNPENHKDQTSKTYKSNSKCKYSVKQTKKKKI